MKNILFLLLNILLPTLTLAEQNDLFEVVSDGDRGLALEWVEKTTSSRYGVDKDGNIYIVTSEYSDSLYFSGYKFNTNNHPYKAAHLMKFNPEGKVLWDKVISSDKYNVSFGGGIKISSNGSLYIACFKDSGDETQVISYDGNPICTIEKFILGENTGKSLILKVDAESGELVKSTWITNVSLTLEYIYNDNLLFSSLCSRLPYENTYEVKIPSGKVCDLVYIEEDDDYRRSVISFDDDLEYKWMLNIDGYDQRGLMTASFAVKDDTLCLYGSSFGDSLNINPLGEMPVYIYSDKRYTDMPKGDAYIAYYDISGDLPVLSKYRKFGRYEYLAYEPVSHIYLYYHPSVGVYLQTYNLHKQTMKNAGDHMYCTIDDNLKIIDDTTITVYLSDEPYIYDDNDNFFVIDGRPYTNTRDSLIINYSKSQPSHSYSGHDMALSTISKFNNDRSKYYWTAVIKRSYLMHMTSCPNYGMIYASFSSTELLPCTPGFINGKEIRLPSSYDAFIAKYRETYKISSGELVNGSVVLPDSMIWHGNDCEIQVVPNKGFQLTSLTANGKEIMPDSEERYYLRNVTEPICVDAQFVENSSVDDVNTLKSKISVYPNPVDDELTIKSDVAPTQMKIYDVAGRQIMMVPDGTTKIDVSSLSAGMYVLKMKVNGVEMQSEFIKK